jgi:hypothetical protein
MELSMDVSDAVEEWSRTDEEFFRHCEVSGVQFMLLPDGGMSVRIPKDFNAEDRTELVYRKADLERYLRFLRRN